MTHKSSLCLTLFLLLFLASCGDDDVVLMPASLCQVTCTDDVTGDTYGIAMRAIAWNDEDDKYDKYESWGSTCNIYVDAYSGQINEEGEFSTAPLSIEADTASEYDEMYTLTFFDLNGNGFTSDHVNSLYTFEDTDFYQLLDESTISISQSDTAIAAEYQHKINPCLINAMVEVDVYCDTATSFVKITCNNPNTQDQLEISEINENQGGIQCEDNEKDEVCLDDAYEINEDDMESSHPDLYAILIELEEEFS